MLVSFYQGLFFYSDSSSQALVTSHSYLSIDGADKVMLNSQISLEDVRKALFGMANFKALGPDSFYPLFFKSKWDTIGPSIYNFAIRVFDRLESIAKVNQTLLTVIPKGNDPSRASDFRHIALCNVFYKEVIKIIANRLKPILPNVISST